MAYDAEWEPEAEADFDRLPPLVASHALDELDRLLQDPVNLSRPAHFPFVPDGLLFRCKPFEHEGATYYLTIAFRYAHNERTIVIKYIATNTSGRGT